MSCKENEVSKDKNSERKFKITDYEEFTEDEADQDSLKADVKAPAKVKVKLYVVNQDGVPADDSVRLVICKISGELVRSISTNSYVPGDYIYPSSLKDYKSTNYKYLGFNQGENYLIFAYSNTTSKPLKPVGFVDTDNDVTNNFVVKFDSPQDYYVKVFEDGFSSNGSASEMPKLVTVNTALIDSARKIIYPYINCSTIDNKKYDDGQSKFKYNQRFILKVNTRTKDKIFTCNFPTAKRSFFLSYGAQKIDSIIYSLPTSYFSQLNQPYDVSINTSIQFKRLIIRKDFYYYLLDLHDISYSYLKLDVICANRTQNMIDWFNSYPCWQ
jgi:hypothetical protein